MNNNVTIAQIKEAYEKATNKGKWIDNGNEFVAENNQRCGIGGFITYEDSTLVALLITEAPNLVTSLEDAQREIFRLNQFIGNQDHNIERLRTEHIAMKDALESALNTIDDAISIGEMEKRNFLFSPWADLVEGSKEISGFISTLQCPTE